MAAIFGDIPLPFLPLAQPLGTTPPSSLASFCSPHLPSSSPRAHRAPLRLMALRFFLAVFVLGRVAATPAATWEPVDEDLDIMALIDDAPEGVSMLQRDSRLQQGAKARDGGKGVGRCRSCACRSEFGIFDAFARRSCRVKEWSS